MSDFQLGPFRLVDHIGEGMMGRVYRGEHRISGAEVAIKVMTTDLARRAHFRRSFRREVRAMARLDHATIAAVYDLGEIDAAAAERSDGVFPPGSPWLAMQFVEGISLNEIPESWGWHRIQTILFALLDGLAHSHSAGVIHRDLKPSNILVQTDLGGPVSLKVVDFGLARILDPDAEAESGEIEEHVAGTPKYMAPEQIVGRRRDQGPWTDLYAVGCLAWQLFTGEPPYWKGDNEAILAKHLDEPPPDFEARLGVPDGLEEWMSGMLEKDPLRRFRRAADAAHALREVAKRADAFGSGDWGDPKKIDPLVTTTVDVALDDTSMSRERSALEIDQDEFDIERLRQHGTEGEGASKRWNTPPIPRDWRRDKAELEERRLHGTGLGLFGLRQIPLVNRQEEREQLWEVLRDAAGRDQSRAVVLRGETGLGKSRLAEWFARRSHELGAATVFRATHSGAGGRRDGLGPMFARGFRCMGLEQEAIVERLERLHDALGIDGARTHHDIRGLAGMMSSEASSSRHAGFANPADRREALTRLLRHLGDHRPVLLCLENAHLGAETLQFVRHLLDEASEDLPVVAALTVPGDLFKRETQARRAVEAIGEHRRGEWCRVGPLSEEAQKKLVGEILGLEPAIVADVAERTEGNPLFAIQLVGDWVERGVLALTEEGFTLEEGVDGEIPDDIHDLWSLRVVQVLDRVDEAERPSARLALERAAAGGMSVSTREWEEICDDVGFSDAGRLLNALLRRGLVETRDEGWAFAHGMLRESLERRAREEGRWEEHHRRCVAMLEKICDVSTPGVPRRLAEHRVIAGDVGGALGDLLEAARQTMQSADYEACRQVIGRRRELVDQLQGELAERAAVENKIVSGELLGMTGEASQAVKRAEAAVERASANGWTDVMGEALRLRASMRREIGELQEAYADAEQALEQFLGSDDEAGVARTHYILGRIEQVRGHTREAEQHYVDALTWFDARDDQSMKALITCDIGYIFITREDWRRARRALKVALEISRRVGNRKVAAKSWNRLGEIARFEKKWEEARACYREAEQLFQVPRNRHVTNLNLAFVELADGHYSEAESVLVLLERSFASTGIHYPQVMLGLACCSAAQEDWENWDVRFGAAVASLRDSGMAHPDLPWLAERNGMLAVEADEVTRARRALAMAAHQWGMLGELEREEEMKGRLAELNKA